MGLSAPRKSGGYQPAGHARVGLAARRIAATILERVVDDRRNPEALLDEGSGLAAWRLLSARDRALVRAIVTAALRHRGQIEQALLAVLDRPPPRKARTLIHALHVAAAQILYLDVPDSAAVDLAVTALSEDKRTARFSGMANAILRRISIEKEALLARPAPASVAFPPWLAAAIRRDHGRGRADAIAVMTAFEPVLDLTPSPRLDSAAVAKLAERIGATILPTGSLRVSSNVAVPELPGFEEGLWWVQDAASALPARLLGDVRGLEVADLCAAPGGKTAQLAAAGAKVTAVDISQARMARLERNLARLALDADLVVADLLKWEPPGLFDAILLDAPCSSTGTMRRHPDIAWTKTPEEVASLASLQREMIARARRLLKPGGVLVYANCSLLKQEGEDLLAALLVDEARGLREIGFEPFPIAPQEVPGAPGLVNGQGALRTLPCDLPADPPQSGGMDGFFACRFRSC